MFLEKIVCSVKKRVEIAKAERPLEKIIWQALNMPPHQNQDYPFEKVLSAKTTADGIAFICEVKKASPSKGVISHDYPYMQIARDYMAGGAAAVSVLTEPEFFLGSGEHLREISNSLPIPTLRKDFIIDPYQIYEAKILGAAAILLIAEILDEAAMRDYMNTAHSLGLSVLAESHSLPQMEKAISAGARVIGVNNRNLETFEVDINTSAELRKKAPKELLFVSESGITSPDDIAMLRENGVNAVLIGETLMRSSDRIETLKILRGAS
ncbi:MAG: indole-3-glycerol phosphate synthase TrpC [Synergistaceae bacterium]|nr:indole-3-glycerol phosphate synthase TrpC [Synergistaceae bacterium]